MVATKRNPVEHEVIAPIADRWSPRAFSPQPVEREKLLSVLEAARWAASSYNEQPWRFIVAAKDDPAEFSRVLSCFREGNQGWAKSAPVVMLVLAKKTFSGGSKPGSNANKHALYDTGAAVAQLSLQATALDLRVHQMAGILPDVSREVFDVPEDFEVVAGIALGYVGELSQLPEDLQAKEQGERKRKPLTEFVFGGAFGQAAALVGARGGHHNPQDDV